MHRWALLLAACGRVDFAAVPDGAVDAVPIPPSIVQVQGPGFQRANSYAVTFPPSVAGAFIVAAGYWNRDPDAMSLTDDEGSVWTALSPAVVPSGCMDGGATGVALWYATLATTAPDTITITGTDTGSFPLGMYVVELAGVVATAPVVAAAGEPAPVASNAMETPALDADTPVAVIALFSDSNNSGHMIPGTGFGKLADDFLFYSMIEAELVPAGTISPTATLPAGTTDPCWAGVAAAFRLDATP